ncbi:thermostable hemolysin [Candidatus Kaiserbacteria bacterium]|nr:thermostable hemolysin [Candidatus Kaiserbacteria bacterium]
MITLDLAHPEDPSYKKIVQFAQEQYLKQISAHVHPSADLFAYAKAETDIVGCMGLYCAPSKEKLLIETYVPGIFSRLTDQREIQRESCAEIGTYVRTKVKGVLSRNIAIALTARLLIAAHEKGVMHICFITSPDARFVVQNLGLNLREFGMPDLEGKEEDFLHNWQHFLSRTNTCFGFTITTLDGCRDALRDLRLQKVIS